MNLLLISLDTLRSDVAYSRTFPTIERLRSSGVTFRTTVSSSPLTPISHATVLTGLQPRGHGIRHLLRERLAAGVPTLATLLRSAGYRTGAVVSCPGLNRWYGLDAGFDWYDDWVPPLADGRNAVEVADVELRGTAMKRAPDVARRALDWVATTPGDAPRFLFAHFFDAHWPYEAPEDVGVAAANPYEGEVAFMDHYLGVLLDGLADAGLDLDQTLTVCFSDHGEDLAGWYPNDHAGPLGHPEERGHGALLFDATQLVPLVVVDPRHRQAARSQVFEQVRLVDVLPTILDLLDLPAIASHGTSAAGAVRGGTIEPRVAYCETFYREELAASAEEWSHLRPLQAVRHPGTKTIWTHGGEDVDVYDLTRDPDEQRPFRVAGRPADSSLPAAAR